MERLEDENRENIRDIDSLREQLESMDRERAKTQRKLEDEREQAKRRADSERRGRESEKEGRRRAEAERDEME